MKKDYIFISFIVVLILIIFGMTVKIIILNRNLSNEKNMVNSLENVVSNYKKEIKERCPEEFNFLD